MKVLLINPPRLNYIIPVTREDRCEVTDRYAVIPPYSLLWLSSILRDNGHSVSLIDANGSGITYDGVSTKIRQFAPDIVIFRFTPTTFTWDMKTAEIAKAICPHVFTIGLCLTLHTLIRDVLEKAPNLDIYIPQNWEFNVPRVITSIEQIDLFSIKGIGFRKGKDLIVSIDENNSDNKTKNDFNKLPIPAFDLIENLSYYRPNTPTKGNYMILYTSKGCPYPCSYCTVAKTPFKLKSSEKVIEELILLYTKYNVRLVSFFDETFTLDRKRTIEICNAIKKFLPELKWYCNTRINLVDPDLLIIMRQSGCRGIAFGIESGNQTILDNVKKGIKIEEAKKAIAWAKEAEIKVYTSFIIGLPGETSETVKETVAFIRETLPHGAQFNVAVPYPGTTLYEQAVSEGWILGNTNWTECYQHHAILRTETMTAENLEKARITAYRSLYFNPAWYIQNFRWVISHPDDIPLGISYLGKIMKNYLLYGMEHAH